ncbi:MAG TPA: hypothetical protein VIO62_06945 [Candidatus Dormibacteraeota bacterium]
MVGRAPRAPAFFFGGGRSARDGLQHGRGALVVILLLAVVAAIGYTAFSSVQVYQQLDGGRRELVAAQAGLAAAGRSGDERTLATVVGQLRQAELDFDDAHIRALKDPALSIVGRVEVAGRQIDATAHLAAIGTDISRAGESAAAIAVEVARLRRQYAGQALTSDNLPALFQQAEAIATKYAASARAIGDQLRAAHAERAAVASTSLVPPLRNAYGQVDAALADADTAFLRYQDVRRVLSDLLGVSLPG